MQTWLTYFFASALLLTSSLVDAKPQRVVSMNLCTDQLVMLLAEPEQLRSIFHLSRRPDVSVMWREAMQIPINHGLAEEIFLMKPDLILAGAYSAGATVDILRRLSRQVEVLQPAYSFEDIRKNIRFVGHLLDTMPRAEALIAEMDRHLQQVSMPLENPVLVASYSANSYTGGKGSLEQQMVEASGALHYGSQKGLQVGGVVPLEVLLMDPPDLLMMSSGWQGEQGRAFEVLQHPVLHKTFGTTKMMVQRTPYWICGSPLVTQEIERLSRFVQAQRTTK